MDKPKIIWTLGAVAMTGASITFFFHEHNNNSLTCQIFHSYAFALLTGFVVARTVHLYLN